MKDLTPEEAGRWMSAAPRIVQDAVTSPATQQVIEQLGKQYSLHVDVVGLLAKLTSYVLLGYAGPEVFLQELKIAGVSEQLARQIIEDINKKVFIPLREQMRKGQGTTPESAKPAVAQPTRPASVGVPRYVPPTTVLPPQKSYSPPPQSPRYANQQDDTSVNAFVRRVEPRPVAPSVSVITPPPAPPAPQRPPQPPPAARPMPPPNLPGALPPRSDIIPPAPKAPAPAPQSSIDPYHEPIE